MSLKIKTSKGSDEICKGFNIAATLYWAPVDEKTRFVKVLRLQQPLLGSCRRKKGWHAVRSSIKSLQVVRCVAYLN